MPPPLPGAPSRVPKGGVQLPGPYSRGCSLTKSMLQQSQEGRQGTSKPPQPPHWIPGLTPDTDPPPPHPRVVWGCCVKAGNHPSSQAVPNKALAASRPGQNQEAEVTLTHGTDTNAVTSHWAEGAPAAAQEKLPLERTRDSFEQLSGHCGPDTLPLDVQQWPRRCHLCCLPGLAV